MENWGKNIEVIGVLFRFNTSRDRTLKTEVKWRFLSNRKKLRPNGYRAFDIHFQGKLECITIQALVSFLFLLTIFSLVDIPHDSSMAVAINDK